MRMALQNRESNEFEAGEEVADFEGGGFRGVRAVSAIVADTGAEVMADGAGLRGPGRRFCRSS
jgi:hypothetical protein